MSSFSRRRFLGAAGAGVGLAAAGGLGLHSTVARAEGEPRFLIMLGCFGGASMIDMFMPIDHSEALSVSGRGTVISHDTVVPSGSNIRCPNRTMPVDFLTKYADQCLVMGAQASSVNHFTAQRRAHNGRGVLQGRTMAEVVAQTYGSNMPLPNVSMGRGGFSEPGSDSSLDPRFRAEVVTNPVTFPLSTSGTKGILPVDGDLAAQDPEMLAAMVARTRALRDGSFEQDTPFARTFAASRRRQAMLHRRATTAPWLEEEDLIERLFYVPDLGEVLPLSEYGLEPSEEANLIRSVLGDALPVDTSGTPDDRLHAQAALAYLLIRTGTSAAVTMTTPGTDGFLAFDQSHQNHSGGQSVHWDRALDVADRLISLLSAAEYLDPETGAGTGTSYWDRTMIVFSTEFGRDKWDTGGSFGTGHHLNNGLLVVSPLVAGNQVLGEADPNNGFICGFDGDTGAPTLFDDIEPGEDPLFTDARLPPGEERITGALLDVLGVSYEGQETLPVIRKT